MNARSGRWAFGLTAGAFVWALGLVAAALIAPFYSGVTESSSGARVSTSSTLVDVNGAGILFVVGIPAALVAIAGIALHRTCTRGSRCADRIAWTAVCALAAFGILGAASIGLLVLPIALLLGVAAALTPSPEAPSHTASHAR